MQRRLILDEFSGRRTWGPSPSYPKVLSRSRPLRAEAMIVVAGPCSVENVGQAKAMAPELAKQGVTFARGGVFRAGTYPRDEFGLRRGLARSWARLCHVAGLKVVMECLDVRQLDFMAGLADAIQVGARHMQDYVLLNEASKLKKPVFLKRAVGATLDEFLGAAEYLARGRCSPILIERGSATHMNHVRWDVSLSLIAAIKRMTGLPILVDASHGTGRRDLVEPVTLAGIAAGADGFLVEVHANPRRSVSDADQAYPLSGLGALISKARAVKAAVSVEYHECMGGAG